MKKLSRNILAGLLSLGLLTGCELDLQPISEIGEGTFYQSDADFNTAIIAAYSGLQAPILNEWALTELRSDNTRLHNSQTASNIYIPLRELDLMTYTAEQANIYTYWADTYHNISRVNTVMDRLDDIQSQALRDQIEGEGAFIRAYHYFNLVRLFEEVFLIDRRISAAEAEAMSPASTEELYQFIVSDLTIAAAQLPKVYPVASTGRATSWAAKALLAKVYRTQRKYTEAEALLAEIVTGSGATLLTGTTGYQQVFSINNEMNKEILFAVRFKAGGLGLGSPLANYFAPQNSGAYVVNGDGNHFNKPTDELVNLYAAKDLRQTTAFRTGYIGAGGKFVPDNYVYKFYSNPAISQDSENDFPIIRYADVLLLYAEALNENGKTATALTYLNQVRQRAGLDAYTMNDVATKQEFVDKLLLERRLELAFENQRWFDLVHFGLVKETLDRQFETELFYQEYTFGVEPVSPDKILIPIPQREVDIFNQ
ncbi:RagB/SusD family nutrient uptake outer membrane protein [Algoriphagus sp. H41]|uniref:RagB/SusD family nutrient uptake outer membrane protein n=1 Tax=Algoriphagus oliviformis TaxID=2811231 RepID=A0ABS3BY27_9BACT|nr:RagB/SusD family nutrient uptake outer membrane protein [Algoriphagus oliviformis]MBN7809764.1 RagB/SusD family nutrient uptake outer membrane protein [Algoriphagus oliviformis]